MKIGVDGELFDIFFRYDPNQVWVQATVIMYKDSFVETINGATEGIASRYHTDTFNRNKGRKVALAIALHKMFPGTKYSENKHMRTRIYKVLKERMKFS